MRCATLVPNCGHYVAYAHPPGRVHRAVPPDQNGQTAFRQRLAARDQARRLPSHCPQAQCRLSNELNRFGCAVQYNRRARADTQLWINWKVRHGSLTHQLPPEFHTPLNRCQLRVLTEKVSLGSKSKGPPGPVPGYRETIKLAIILNHMPLDRNQWWWVKAAPEVWAHAGVHIRSEGWSLWCACARPMRRALLAA